MAEPLAAEPVPLHTDEHGVLRVGGTRVPLETLITEFDAGASPEEIVENYPLRLDDVYATITYYLRNQDVVRSYLGRRERQMEAVREQNRARLDHEALRRRLLARLESSS